MANSTPDRDNVTVNVGTLSNAIALPIQGAVSSTAQPPNHLPLPPTPPPPPPPPPFPPPFPPIAQATAGPSDRQAGTT